MHTLRWAVASALLLMTLAVAAETIVVRYPRPEADVDKRTEYPLKLLELAFQKMKVDYSLVPTEQLMNQGRALQLLRSGSNLDVVWSMTSDEREKELLPVRIPIYKGLIGWRIFLINESDVERLSRPMTAHDMKQFLMVQGHDWPDAKILQMNGYKVLGTPNYETIFDMLARRRVDLFPRSIVEIWAELENHREMGLAIEQTKLLRYPTAFYYFVAPDNKELEALIEEGLLRALADGSFDDMFFYYHGELLNKAKLAHREVYMLTNPILPEKTPLHREGLWYQGYEDSPRVR
ncbi:hypothetical protein O5O45_26995 [Hahella aquimaris]|uniref:substrate-binding periplasmic protein n=1 Tax=Hahella sp. HNIBRBA332 TaxID=3015983 RepID=UPI00273C91B5|nr:hypothetical protein [Hahella sp. HNIBRBA332]WLQ13376.1 hypothetical protein O5O45_26995 [Hahella sp. HNIBRBA332]